jgi:hypothetical protein
MSQFVRVSKANGESFYFNMAHVTFIHDNPADKFVIVIGNGFEKKFRQEEAAGFLGAINAQATDVTTLTPQG